jgi:integrase
MFRIWKLSPNTVTQRLAALRFLYKVLKRGWSVAETPYPKKVLRLPQILSQEEVGRLIDAAETPFHRVLLMTLYATGGRRAEVARLKITDINSEHMVVHIRDGKGRKDRDVMLSPALLAELRIYWRGLKTKPTDWNRRPRIDPRPTPPTLSQIGIAELANSLDAVWWLLGDWPERYLSFDIAGQTTNCARSLPRWVTEPLETEICIDLDDVD